MAVFYTSDTHFNEQRAFELSLRNMYFKDIQEYNQEVVKRWNSVVSKEDTVYHLGDFGDFTYLQHLNGKIIFLYGNYERAKSIEQIKPYLTQFLEVYDKEYILLDMGLSKLDEDILLVHEPENKLKYEDKTKEGIFYLFGHIHEKQKVKRNGLNVGVDNHNFYPVSDEVLKYYKKAIQNYYDDNCFNSF